MTNDLSRGAHYLTQGIRWLLSPGLRRYVVVPFIINLLAFSAIIWLGYSQFSLLLDWVLPEAGWVSYLRWLLWPLFTLVAVLITFYTFTMVANLLAAPFNGLLAEKMEQQLTDGIKPTTTSISLGQSLLPSVISELRKTGYFLLRALPLLILFLIPGINLIAPVLWLLFNAWYLSVEYGDYPMANNGLGFQQQYAFLKKRRLTALGFGAAITLMMMVPILNFAAMPAAVIGATLFWHNEQAQAN